MTKSLASDQALLGFDIGGTKCAVVAGLVEPEGVQILSRSVFPTEPGPEANLLRMERLGHEMLDDLGLHRVSGVGVSCGGPLDSRLGLVLSPPNLPGWDHIPVLERLSGAFQAPARLENDANAGALSEWRWGAGKGTKDMIFLTFGTGMGAGLILNGSLFRGACDLAGEVGHVRLADDGPACYGKAGSFEGLCSGAGIARLATAIPSFGDETTAADVFNAARQGELAAVGLVDSVARNLGLGLSMLVDLLNPEMIVLGSIFVRQEALLRPAMEEVLRREALPLSKAACRIVPAQLTEQVGDYAALAVAALATESIPS